MHTFKDQRACGSKHARGRPWIAGLLGSLAVVAILIVLFATSEPVQAAVFHCPGGDVACLIAAINTANGNGEEDTITLAAGIYTLTTVDNETDGANGLPSITSALTIQGASAESTILERVAESPFFPLLRLLHVSADGVLQIEGLTVRGGRAGDGGGILNFGDVRITNSNLTGNQAFDRGGGLANVGGTVTIAQSLVTDNSSGGFGGGLWSTGTVQIIEASFLDNRSAHTGAGFENCSGSATIAATTFARNQGDGAIITNFTNPGDCGTLEATMTILNTTVADNGGIEDGGIINAATMLVLNSAIVRNRPGFGDGAIQNFGTSTLINTTVAANSALESNHVLVGIFNGNNGVLTLINTTVVDNQVGLVNSGTEVSIVNSLLARNTDSTKEGVQDCFGPVTSLGHNLIGDPTGCTITLQSSDLTGNPGLGSLVDDGTPGQAHVPLLATSRAINAGDHEVCADDPRLAADQLGQPRVGICDIGAIEFPHPIALVNASVAFDPVPATFTFTDNPTGCPTEPEFVGKFSFVARLTNTSDHLLSDLFVAVTTLTNGNLLQNADGGPGGVGAQLTVPQQDGFTDGVLSPDEFVDVPFVICLQERQPFQFVVDVLGVVDAGANPQARAQLVR